MTSRKRGAAGAGLWLLGRFSRSRLAQNEAVSQAAEKIAYQGARAGFRAVGAVARSFKAVQKLLKPSRPAATHSAGLFDLTPTEEQAMVQDAMQRFAAERLRPLAAESEHANSAPKELLEEAAALGLCSLCIPSELGGVGDESSIVTRALAAQAMAHGDMGLAVACLAPSGVAAALAEWGTPEQQAKYLPEFAGEKPPVASIAILEPRALFDPFELQTTAEKDGDGYVLNGEKSLVPCAADAELMLVAAQTETGPALFIVEAGTAGLSVEAEPGMGLRAAGLSRVRLKKLRLPADARLGGDKGLDYLQLVQRSRLAWCALATGTAQAVLDHVIPYVNERQAFGEPISHRQSVAFLVSNIAVDLNGMRLLTWRAAARADRQKDFSRDAALARRACAEHGMRIGSDGVQLLGGHGFVKEHPVERWYRDLRAVGLMEGGVML
jgi:alkylation response protein AidB-like acyl-CoA dehydrogenase